MYVKILSKSGVVQFTHSCIVQHSMLISSNLVFSYFQSITYFQSINKFVFLSTKHKIDNVIGPNDLKNRK